MAHIDLNADLGESFGAYTIGNDAEMMDLVSSANVGCGFHGGDPVVMHRTLQWAKERGVGVGAHPGFNDLWGFGRRQIMGESPADIEKLLIYQIGAIQGMAQSLDMRVTHCKIHGALNNMACEDIDLALAAARAVHSVDRDLLFVVLSGSALERAGEELGLPLAREIFADRAYEDNGMLVSRKKDGAMIEDADYAGQRIVEFIEDGAIRSLNGTRIPMQIDTVCVHGDTPSAVTMAKSVRAKLLSAGIEIKPMHQTLASS